MLRLLNIEWNKIYYYKTARIFTILYFVMLILIGVGISVIRPDVGGVSMDLKKLGVFDFPFIWQNLTYLFAFAKIFLAVIIVTNITNEYSNGTLKQNLIDGFSKSEFLKSKLLTNFILAGFSTVFVFVIVLILGFFISPIEHSFLDGIEFIGAYFLKLILFFSICLFFAVFLKKSAFALLGIVVWWMIEKCITLVEFLVKGFQYDWDMSKVAMSEFWITDYLPLNTSYNLITMPGFNPMNFLEGKPIFKISPIEISFVIVTIIYISLIVTLTYRMLKRRDL